MRGSIGSRIRKYREAAGLSQRGLAALLGVKQSTISQWEVGDTYPLMRKLPRIAKALGISSEELMIGRRVA